MREIDDSGQFIGRTGAQHITDVSPSTVPGAARWLAADVEPNTVPGVTGWLAVTPSASTTSLAAMVQSADDDERYARILELVDATVGDLAP